MKNIVLILIFIVICGCTSVKLGYTQVNSMNRYLLVDKENNSFGFRRLSYNIELRSSIRILVESNGLPDFIYEYKNNKKRFGIKLFYHENDLVLEEKTWLLDSMYIKEKRGFREKEKLEYEDLSKGIEH